MIRSLRTRLILSHVLPLLIILPLLGVALTYLLETQVLLAGLSEELERQAALVAAVARDYPQIWYDQDQAQSFMALIAPRLSAEVMFFDPNAVLLASSDSADHDLIGTQVVVPGFREAVLSRTSVRVDYGEQPGTGSADVLMPVLTPFLQVVGVVRLTDPLSSVYERFPRTRTLILWVLAVGTVLGVIVGWVLAIDLARPLRRATRSIAQMAEGQPLVTLHEQGPEEVRLLLRAFNGLTEQLRNLERARKRLLANLVHELGRPLGALLSATQALAAGAYIDPELRGELLDGMLGQMRRMRHLLDDLTQLHGQAQGALSLRRSETPFVPWLNQVLSPWREVALEKGLHWRVRVPATLPALHIDADRMAQALGNLLSNAIKYTPGGGEVVIAAGEDVDHAWVKVIDSGPGIPEEELERVFEPFYRGPGGRRFPQGMGLGLSIARDLVNAHGGSLTVQSVAGQGSTFMLTLPRV